MFKKVLYVIFITLGTQNVSAQWDVLNLNTTSNLNSISYLNNNDIWVGSDNQIIKTSNGGSSWTILNPLKDNINNNIYGSIDDIAIINSNNVIAAGLFYTGNDEIVLKTTNGGVNWNYAYIGNGPAWPQVINAIDVLGANSIAVGNSGRILYSNNYGSSWNIITNGITSMINDVKYINQDTIFGVGNNLMIRSIDGGLNWSTIYTGVGEFISIGNYNQTIYVGQKNSNKIFKTNDFGTTVDTLTLPFYSTGNLYTINENTVLLSGDDDLYLTIDGGTSWEKYQLSNYQKVNRIDFLNSSTGIAVGDSGYVLSTVDFTNIPTFPISEFSIQGGSTNYCLGDSIVLNNQTYPSVGYSYEWQLNGVTFSTQFNTGIKLNSSGTQEINLIVTNVNGSSSFSLNVNVTGHDLNNFTVLASEDTTCLNNYASFSIPNSQVGVTYQLRKEYTNINSSQTGNGSALTFFYSQPLTAETTFNIKASKTNSCFTDSLLLYKTIYIVSDSSGISNACSISNNYCPTEGITNVTFGDINNTTNTLLRNYFDYSCSQYTSVVLGQTYPISITVNSPSGEYVKVWFDLNNNGQFETTEEVFTGFAQPTISSNITIPNTFLFNQKIRMRVVSDQTNAGLIACYIGSTYCGQIEDYGIIITPAPTLPIAGFTDTTITNCTANVTFTNTSYNSATYLWDFGDGNTSNLVNPTHEYTVSGNYDVKLIVYNINGTDTFIKNFSFIIPEVPMTENCTRAHAYLASYASQLTYLSIDTTVLYNFTYLTNFHDFTCTKQVTINSESAVTFTLKTSSFLGGGCGRFSLWIDFNNDGILDATEKINTYSGIHTGNCSGTQPVKFYFQIPNTAVQNTPLRMRFLSYDSNYHGYLNNACNNGNVIRIGSGADYTLFINTPQPVQASFLPNDSVACSFNNVRFDTPTSTNASTYIWDFGDGIVDTTSSISYSTYHTYTVPGIYTVKLIALNSLYSDTLILPNCITINEGYPRPVVSLIGSTLYSDITYADNYQWYKNGSPISGAIYDSLAVSSSGNYYVVVTKNNGCSNFSVGVSPLIANFTVSPISGCETTRAYFYNASYNATSYTIDWGDGTTVNWAGAGTPYHDYVTGLYTIKLIACSSTYVCDTMIKVDYVIVGDSLTPDIAYNNNILYTTVSAPIYQWHLSGNPINGANDSLYVPSQPGVYSVQILGCNLFSDDYTYTPAVSNFSTNQSVFCSDTSASVVFDNLSLNADSCLWDFGDGNTSSQTNPSHLYNNVGNYTVTLYSYSDINIDTLVMTDFIKIYNNSSFAEISLLGSTSYCYGGGTSTIYTNNYNNQFSYNWFVDGSPFSPQSDTSCIPYDSGNYYLQLTDSMGCIIHSDTINIFIDWFCVSPGDADFSYVVDNYDFLEIGLNYGYTGIPRATISNDWMPFPSTDWGITTGSSQIELKHVDCNGDGTIDSTDFVAIHQNYSSEILSSMLPITSKLNAPELYFYSSATTYQAGDTVEIDVLLGNQIDSVESLYGIAFNLKVNNSTLIELGSLNVSFQENWLVSMPPTNGINFFRFNELTEMIDMVSIRINHIDTFGYGKLATLRFIVPNNLSINEIFELSALYGYAVNANADDITFNIGTPIQLNFQSITTNIQEFSSNNYEFLLNPNPFIGKCEMSYSLKEKAKVYIEVYNSMGKKLEVLEDNIQDVGYYSYKFGDKYNAGVYYIKTLINKDVFTRKVIKVEY